MCDRVLAIDVGTSSTRAIVFDSAGRAVEGLKAQAAYSTCTEPPGAATLDPDDLVEKTAGCIDEVIRLAGSDADRIAAVGVCTFWHSMLGVDSAGQAVTPLYTWADSRSAEAARNLQLTIDNCQLSIPYHPRTGCRIHPSYFPARLLWLSESEPELFSRVNLWMSPGEYLFQRFFGEAGCSISMASGTGLFNQNRCDWDDEILAALPITRDSLSPLTDIDGPAQGLLPEWATRWRALAEVPWVPAVGDGAASNLGSGCTNDRRIAINLGTSGAIRVLFEADSVEIPPGLWCYRLDKKRFVMGGAFSDGGYPLIWAHKALKLPDTIEIQEELARREPDSHGLTILPFFAGERSIGWRPAARATIHGFTLATTPLDIIQAILEGVALRLALVADVIRRQFPLADEIIASGGALAQWPIWGRILADAIGQPITVSTESEASSRGAALLALRAAGILNDEADAPPPPGQPIQPDSARHEAYGSALERQQELYRRLL